MKELYLSLARSAEGPYICCITRQTQKFSLTNRIEKLKTLTTQYYKTHHQLTLIKMRRKLFESSEEKINMEIKATLTSDFLMLDLESSRQLKNGLNMFFISNKYSIFAFVL